MRYIHDIDPRRKTSLDLKDKRILFLLSENARMPATQIARKVGLSRDAVSYRINNFEKKGVLQGYRTIIDINKLGYDPYHIFMQLSQPSKEAEKELIAKLKKYPFTRAILKFNGKFDLEIAVAAKSIHEFDAILNTLLSDCREYLNDYDIVTITKNYVQRAFPISFLKATGTEKPTQAKKSQHKGIDAKDRDILRIISDNAAAKLYDVGERTGLSADAVNYRIKQMRDQGLIQKFTIALNYSALAYEVHTVLLNILSLTPEKERMLKELLRTDENIIWAVKTIGRYNLLMYICVPNSERLYETITRLRSKFPKDIRGHETMIAYEEYKCTYFPGNIDIEQ